MSPRPKGMPSSLDYPEASVGDILAGSARRYPDRIALLDGDQALTHAQLHEQALRFAQGLREHGIGSGDVVALHQPNSIWFTVSYYGAILAGAAITPVNPTLPPAAVCAQLTESGAVAAVTHPATAAALQAAGAEALRLVVLVPPTAAAPAPEAAAGFEGAVPLGDLLAAEPVPAPGISPDSTAHLSFTGGTTGRSKAVQVLHRNVVCNAIQFTCWRGATLPRVDAQGGIYLEPEPAAATAYTVPPGSGTIVLVSPLFHALGLISQTNAVLAGHTSVFSGRFDARHYLDQLEEHGATHVTGSPAFFHGLLAAPDTDRRVLESVRLVNSGAAPIDTTTLRAVQRLFPHACVIEGYGLTEATMGLTSGVIDPDKPSPIGSVGLPVFDTEIEIRDLAAPARTVPVGGTGELWAWGPQITAGYLGHPELTAEQFTGGWLRTGDLARFDEEGNVHIVGRAKDMLIYKGYNVYPSQLEEVLGGHPAVEQVSVIGVPAGDAGEIPAAYDVVRQGKAEPGPTLAEELLAFVAARVAPYQKVRQVHFLGSLPTSAAGKILKAELRQLHERPDHGR
ncbi:class I adenylate-forming enzyme family protein [Streptomyces sp. NPDC021080]|uniref:class I adenylate-forming enzyme family protein n=1 Tax=Streptomyces sp. NPDC021080 TaxID=3365110 RepID=UPI0037888DBF